MSNIDENQNMTECEGMDYEYDGSFFASNSSYQTRPDTKIKIKNSEYSNKFDQIEIIAQGGFGTVYRARHKIDGIEYAVKKIRIKFESDLLEAQILSSLRHSNIVEYKAAWLEKNPNESESSSSNSSQDDRNGCNNFNSNNHDEEMISLEEWIVFRNSVTYKTTSRYKSLDLRECFNIESNLGKLYIQMPLCQSNLKQWLEKRDKMQLEDNLGRSSVPISKNMLEKTNISVFEILGQLLKGLQYIHNKGIVHHDIKPGNIFIPLLHSKIIVQLGDFGLACQNVSHRPYFGTELYAAPEQMAGICDKKNDMYSLGIVLLELAQNFGSDMERMENIVKLRNGNLPEKLLLDKPQFAQIIQKLTLKNLEKRSDATELLKSIQLKY